MLAVMTIRTPRDVSPFAWSQSRIRLQALSGPPEQWAEAEHLYRTIGATAAAEQMGMDQGIHSRQCIARGITSDVIPLMREAIEAIAAQRRLAFEEVTLGMICLLYTSDAADDLLCVDLGGRRII